MKRVQKISRHLTASGQAKPDVESPEYAEYMAKSLDRHTDGTSAVSQPSAEHMVALLKGGYDTTVDPEHADYAILNNSGIPGPMDDIGKRYKDKFEILYEYAKANQAGSIHLLWEDHSKKYGKQGMASNFLLPVGVLGRDEVTGKSNKPEIRVQVMVNDTKDSRRIAKNHVQKQPKFTTFLFGSVLSTTNSSNWMHQREAFNLAFLPKLSLMKLLPISLDRASKCTNRLYELSNGCKDNVDINDFFLFETMAQLQLGLFGETEEVMLSTNDEIRKKLSGEKTGDIYPLLKSFIARADSQEKIAPNPDIPGNERVVGPLSVIVRETEDARGKTDCVANNYEKRNVNFLTKIGNALIFHFAGHDTTGHTLSFLSFELARHPSIQERLLEEVDQFWKMVDDREIVYEDLKSLKFMTRCITETLRLWMVVPQGTHRVLEYDDFVHIGNRRVKLPKGTLVQIPNWNRHRDPNLWGDDSLNFNPDRSFADTELWHNTGLSAYNPHTDRFSPFTFTPRDCIGKNFAQMEMRTIMLSILRKYKFELSEPYKEWNERDSDGLTRELGVNLGTMGPRDITKPKMVKYFNGSPKPPYGLPLKIIPR